MPLTPDAIPTNEQVRETLLDRVYHPYKKQLIALGVLAALAIVGFLAFRELRRQHLDEQAARYTDATSAGVLTLNPEVDPEVARKQLESLRALVLEYPDDAITPRALLALVDAHAALGEYEQALERLEQLRTEFKDFSLNTLPADTDPAGRARSLAQVLETKLRQEREWAKKTTYVHHWPAEDRLALVETTAGSFWVGFYDQATEAPRHVEAFVQRAKAGQYNGTQIYFVRQGPDGSPQAFEAGSTVSKPPDLGGERDPSQHDRDEPADVIEPEDTRFSIRHQYRVVSSALMATGESASRFTVVAKRDGMDSFDGERTPWGAVMEREGSLDVIETIARAPTYGTHSETASSAGAFKMRDHPYPPIHIRRVSIWKDEKIEEGHTWDSSRVSTSDAEPWEASIVAPKPDEFTPPEPPKKEEGTPPDEGQAPEKDEPAPKDEGDDEGGDDETGGDK